jgi:glycogen debranching enzyme
MPSSRRFVRFALLLLCVPLPASGAAHSTSSGQASSAPTAADAPPGIPRFDLPTSGLEWKTPAHPLRYFDATGRRAGVFGKQTGQFEAWIYPIKVLKGFRLEFRQEGMPEPVRGENYLEQVIVRPESTTLVYVHPNFTVRQIIWVPFEEPAIVMFFDVDSAKPISITAKFVPEFKPMWPASLGGQYSYWIDEDKAFGLTDATSRPTALIGSPAVGAFTEHMDHALVGGEMLLQLRATPEQAHAMLLPLVMSLSMESSAKAREIYRGVLDHLRPLFEQRVTYHRDFLARTMEIETPDPELNRAFTWAKVAIDAGWVCHPTYGCGLVAGYGPAGDYERPGFAWWFGGDALMATWAMEDYGDFAGALQALRFLKARQRADGKMMHEMTQSVDLVDWFGKYGFAYYHADTTPMYLYSIAEYWRRTGDKKFLEEFWPSAKKAYEYCLSTLDPADGLMDNTKAGLAAVEVGPLRGKVTKDIYLEGFWLAGLNGMQDMATAMGDTQLADDTRDRHARAASAISQNWWNREGDYFAFGVDAQGNRVEMVGIWSAVMLAVSGYTMYVRDSVPGIDVFARPELATDWGERWLSNKDELYDPVSYNNGTAWPFMSGIVAWAQYANGHPLAGFAALNSIAHLTGVQSPGHMPEHMNGNRNTPGARSVPHQLFSSVGVVVPVVRGLLGLQASPPKALKGALLPPSVSMDPLLPATWDHLLFRRYSVGGHLVTGEFRRQPGRLEIRLEKEEDAALPVLLSSRVPLGARIQRVLIDGTPTKFAVFQGQEGTEATTEVQLKRSAEIVVEYEGGIGIVPIAPKPEPGDRTTSLKIIRVEQKFDSKTCPLQVTVAGLSGRTYSLDLITTLPQIRAEGFTLRKTENGFRLDIPFEGTDYVTRQVCIAW